MTGLGSVPGFLPAVTVVLVALTVAAGLLTLTAVAIHVAADRSEARRAARWARWKPMLLDALVGEREPSSLALLVSKGERGDYFRLLIAFALRLRDSSRDVLVEAAAPHLDAALPWLDHPRADRRALATHLLGLLGSDADRRRLLPLLSDPSPEVAMTAARALARSGDLAYARPLVAALDRFETWGSPAVASMLVLFGIRVGPTLQAGLASRDLGELGRTACTEALRRLGYVPAADTAATVLRGEPPAPLEVRAAALRLLHDVGSPGHAEVVRPLCDDAEEVIRLHAISALAALGSRPEDTARLEAALHDPSSWVALRAARGLAASGQTAPLQTLAARDTPAAPAARRALAEAGLPSTP